MDECEMVEDGEVRVLLVLCLALLGERLPLTMWPERETADLSRPMRVERAYLLPQSMVLKASPGYLSLVIGRCVPVAPSIYSTTLFGYSI